MPSVSSQMMTVPYDRAATLHIGVITPPFVPVPPLAYGGTEPMADTLCRSRQRRSSSDALFDNGRAEGFWPTTSANSLKECRRVTTSIAATAGSRSRRILSRAVVLRLRRSVPQSGRRPFARELALRTTSSIERGRRVPGLAEQRPEPRQGRCWRRVCCSKEGSGTTSTGMWVNSRRCSV